LKFATAAKKELLREILAEYGRAVNWFIGQFWASCPSTSKLLKPIVDGPIAGLENGTWLNYTMRQTAAREAIAMVTASKKRWKDRAVMPIHKGEVMRLSTGNVKITEDEPAFAFDLWLRISAGDRQGDKIVVRLPMRKTKHLRKLEKSGKRNGSFLVTANEIFFSYTTQVEEAKGGSKAIGVDTGIKALASLSTGEQYGRRLQDLIEFVKRTKRGSQAEGRARRRLKQYIDVIAKTIAAKNNDLVVVEDLTGISHGTKLKGRLSRNMRSTIGNWNWRYWMGRLENRLKLNGVRFEQVPPAYTSQTCHQCGHVDRANRNGEKFRCRDCGHSDNADINAAKNILARFVGGVKAPPAKG
jgi:IS605 OrfB family transposase